MSSRKQLNRISLKASRGIFLLSLSLVSVLLLTPSLADAATLSKPQNNLGLVGYWPLEEGSGSVATDHSGGGNHGTLQENPLWIQGKHGTALEFDGSDNFVAGTIAALSGPLTVSGWVEVRSTERGRNWFSLEDDDGNPIFSIGLSNSGHTIRVADSSSNILLNVRTAASVGWVHLTVTWDGSTSDASGLNIYKNGELSVDNRVANGGSVTLPQNYLIGRGSQTFGAPAAGRTWLGIVDEVRIYNRALSASEIQNLYEAGRATIGGGYENRYSDGLVGYWSFDGNDIDTSSGTVYDRSGGGNNGTIAGGTVHASDGRLGQSVHFPASENSSRINVGADSSISNIFNGGGSIVAWIHPTGWGDDEGQGAGGSIFSKTNASLGIGYWFAVSDLTDSLVFALLRSNVGQWSAPSNAITLDTWHHVAVTYDDSSNSNDPTLYIDGVEQSITEFATPSGTPASDALYDAMIGSLRDTLYNFDGKIDELRVYNKILSPEEIKGLYNLGQVTIGGSSTSGSINNGLIAHWDFNGKSMDWANNEALDVSGNGHDGTLVSSPRPAPGVVGQGLDFDGDNDEISVSVDLTASLAMTMCAWAKHHSLSSAVTIYGASQSYFVNIGNRLRFRPTNSQRTEFNRGTVSLNEWYHWCLVRDAGGMVSVYKNAVPLEYNSGSNPNTDKATLTRIGQRGGGSEGFNGVLDELRIYNRALSEAEIWQLYTTRR